MIYLLRGENDLSNPLDTVLKNRGVDKSLFEVNERDIEDYEHYDNMILSVEKLLEHIEKGSKIEIVIDEDCDGNTSGATIFRYIRDVMNYKNLFYKLHTKKVHGLSEDIVIDSDTNLIIVPDAGSNDFKQHKYYYDKGIDIIVVDHHLCDKYSEHAIIVNNRMSKNVNNKELSGVGVVYKFLKVVDDYIFEDGADNYLDLLALGNIADVIDLRSRETRYLCYQGIKNVKNPFIKALIEISNFELEGKYNIDKIGWTICPKINGCIRSGTQEIKEEMFKAFISDDYEYCLEVANKCKKAKSSQDSAVKSILPKIESLIEVNENDRFVFVEAPKNLKQEHTGLVANKIQDKYGMGVFIYRDLKDGTIGGNVRGNSNHTFSSRQDFIKSELFTMAEGQPNAHGAMATKENLPKIKEYLNNLYKDKPIVSGKTHLVDFVLNENNLNNDIIEELAKYEDEWGNKLDSPVIYFDNLMINIEDDNIIGTKQKRMEFEVNGVKFVKKYLSNVIKDSFLNKGFMFVNIVGKPIWNVYKRTSQVEIIDIEVV